MKIIKDLQTNAFYIANIKGKGRGVVSKFFVNSGNILFIDPILLLNERDSHILEVTDLNRYFYCPHDLEERRIRKAQDKPLLSALGLGYSSLLNHSEDENAEWEINTKKKLITIRALRYINPGEEITIDYGYNPLEERKW